jgi:hypothetical protein
MTCHAARRIPVSIAYVDAEADVGRCPFLVDLTPDWRVVHPPTVACRRPDGRVRIPSAATLAARCEGDRFRDCDGYASFAAAQPDEADPDGG